MPPWNACTWPSATYRTFQSRAWSTSLNCGSSSYAVCHAFLPAVDLGPLIASSPALEKLAFVKSYGLPKYIDIRSPRLKCLRTIIFHVFNSMVDAASLYILLEDNPRQMARALNIGFFSFCKVSVYFVLYVHVSAVVFLGDKEYDRHG